VQQARSHRQCKCRNERQETADFVASCEHALSASLLIADSFIIPQAKIHQLMAQKACDLIWIK
jgi:hypothetical protein